MTISAEQIEEWLRLADAATEGPWTAIKAPHGPVDVFDRKNEDIVTLYMGGPKRGHNARHIAASRTAVPALVSKVKEQAAEIERLREIVRKALTLKGGWREAIVELEDYCSERVRLKNMLAAADQLDEWATLARSALPEER